MHLESVMWRGRNFALVSLYVAWRSWSQFAPNLLTPFRFMLQIQNPMICFLKVNLLVGKPKREGRDRKKERNHPPAGSHSKCLPQPRQGQSKVKNQKPYPGLQHGWVEPTHMCHDVLLEQKCPETVMVWDASILRWSPTRCPKNAGPKFQIPLFFILTLTLCYILNETWFLKLIGIFKSQFCVNGWWINANSWYIIEEIQSDYGGSRVGSEADLQVIVGYP